MVKRTPTDGELAILNVLWKQGPCTVRHVHQALHGGSAAAYTSTLKLMQIMHDKGADPISTYHDHGVVLGAPDSSVSVV